MRRFKTTTAHLYGPGERAALVTEQFTLEEALRQRRAIELHKRLLATRAQPVHPCHKLLARATLPAVTP